MRLSYRMWTSGSLLGPACLVLSAGGLLAQAGPAQHDRGIFATLSNYRTVPDRFQIVKPLTPGEKLQLAAAPAWDRRKTRFLHGGRVAKGSPSVMERLMRIRLSARTCLTLCSRSYFTKIRVTSAWAMAVSCGG